VADDKARKREILALLDESAHSSDRTALKQKLLGTGQPVYTPDPEHPGLLVRIEPDGTRTPGRLEGRTFVAADSDGHEHFGG
jgi:hypothetical protein